MWSWWIAILLLIKLICLQNFGRCVRLSFSSSFCVSAVTCSWSWAQWAGQYWLLLTFAMSSKSLCCSFQLSRECLLCALAASKSSVVHQSNITQAFASCTLASKFYIYCCIPCWIPKFQMQPQANKFYTWMFWAWFETSSSNFQGQTYCLQDVS